MRRNGAAGKVIGIIEQHSAIVIGFARQLRSHVRFVIGRRSAAGAAIRTPFDANQAQFVIAKSGTEPRGEEPFHKAALAAARDDAHPNP